MTVPRQTPTSAALAALFARCPPGCHVGVPSASATDAWLAAAHLLLNNHEAVGLHVNIASPNDADHTVVDALDQKLTEARAITCKHVATTIVPDGLWAGVARRDLGRLRCSARRNRDWILCKPVLCRGLKVSNWRTFSASTGLDLRFQTKERRAATALQRRLDYPQSSSNTAGQRSYSVSWVIRTGSMKVAAPPLLTDANVGVPWNATNSK